MYSQQELHQLITRLKDYYPNRADEAVDILVNDYELPIPFAAALMYLVKTMAEKNNYLKWPTLDISYTPFFVN